MIPAPTGPSLPPGREVACALGAAYGANPRQVIDLAIPARAQGPLVCCVHGGWWVTGRPADLRPLLLELAERGLAAAAIGFRQFADAARDGGEIADDIAAGCRRALEEAALLGLDSRSLILLGCGSGSLPALLAAARLAPEGLVRGAIAAGITPGCNPADAPPRARDLTRFAGARAAELSPLLLAPASLPPLLLLHADADPEVAPALAQRLHQHAVEGEVPSSYQVLHATAHDLLADLQAPAARAALDRIAAFHAEQAHGGAEPPVFAGRLEQ